MEIFSQTTVITIFLAGFYKQKLVFVRTGNEVTQLASTMRKLTMGILVALFKI